VSLLLLRAPTASAAAAGAADEASSDLVEGTARAGSADEASSDLVEGTARLADLGRQALQVSLRGGPPLTDESTEGRRRFGGVITVPGLSSFSFIHGLLVGCAAIAFFWTFGSSSSSGSNGSNVAGTMGRAATASGLSPEHESALRALLADSTATFQDPQVHQAVEEVKRDIANIAKYKDNERVMAAFAKLLEIEGILERL